MPYYIYRVTQLGPVKQLDKLAQFDGFKEASGEAKRLRKEEDLTRCKIQVVFGENELQAEEVLSVVREAQPIYGDD
jgi:dihydrodipicolinate synthase/N-acetylneuraminate lyase